ncbi:putative retroelement [Sesbania bispinosa]|nr:putative retroelement [Sesbania bispinosa]
MEDETLKTIFTIELPGSYGVSTIFNIEDLSSYLDNKVELDSRASPVQTREDET